LIDGNPVDTIDNGLIDFKGVIERRAFYELFLRCLFLQNWVYHPIKSSNHSNYSIPLAPFSKGDSANHSQMRLLEGKFIPVYQVL